MRRITSTTARRVSGYAQSLALEDGVILTIAGTCDHQPAQGSWHDGMGKSDLTAIRWKPLRD